MTALGSGDHVELARLADAATKGPWQWVGDDLRSLSSSHSVIVDGGYDGMWIPSDVDAAFIAAANPATVLALLAEIAALRSELDQARSLHHRATDRSRHWEIAALRAEARADQSKRRLAHAEGLLKRIAEDGSYDGPSSARLYFGTRVAQ